MLLCFKIFCPYAISTYHLFVPGLFVFQFYLQSLFSCLLSFYLSKDWIPLRKSYPPPSLLFQTVIIFYDFSFVSLTPDLSRFSSSRSCHSYDVPYCYIPKLSVLSQYPHLISFSWLFSPLVLSSACILLFSFHFFIFR